MLLLGSLTTTKAKTQQTANNALKAFLDDAVIKQSHAGVYIYDVTAAKAILQHQADHYFIPASNTKLFSLYAGMKYLGDSLTGIRFDIQQDTLFLYPSADPTFLMSEFSSQPLDKFLAANKKPVAVLQNELAFNARGKGWTFDDKDAYYAAERSAFPIYGNVITIKSQLKNKIASMVQMEPPLTRYQVQYAEDHTLTEVEAEKDDKSGLITITYPAGDQIESINVPFETDGINTSCMILQNKYKTPFFSYKPAPGRLFNWKTVKSQPVDSLFRSMMYRSDNMYAEHTLLMASLTKLGVIADKKMISWLLENDLKDLRQKPQWVDGSGLSRYNLFTPMDMADIILKMQKIGGWDRLKAILPTGGSGTLKNYYLDKKGTFFAKTGTLSNNVSLSGFFFTKTKKIMVFSVMVNNHPGSAKNVRVSVEKLLSSIISTL